MINRTHKPDRLEESVEDVVRKLIQDHNLGLGLARDKVRREADARLQRQEVTLDKVRQEADARLQRQEVTLDKERQEADARLERQEVTLDKVRQEADARWK